MVVFFYNANDDFIQLLPKFFKNYGVEVIPNAIPKAGERFMTLSLGLKFAKEVRQTKSGAKMIKLILWQMDIGGTLEFVFFRAHFHFQRREH